MTSSNFASFAPYTPPPDEELHHAASIPTRTSARAWFPSQSSVSPSSMDSSYQAGGIPTFGTSVAGGAGSLDSQEAHQNQWETRYGLRVDMLAASAYVLGPVSALLLLIMETHNDYVRYHAYQSALITTPLILARMLLSIFRFPAWTGVFFTLIIVVLQIFMALRAYWDASQRGLARFHAPIVGSIANQWLADE